MDKRDIGLGVFGLIGITYFVSNGMLLSDYMKKRKHKNAETFDAELKKDSCCCGATVENPCLCMEEGVMNCSAVEPKCPCYAAKDAESFGAELNQKQLEALKRIREKRNKSSKKEDETKCPCGGDIVEALVCNHCLEVHRLYGAESFEADECSLHNCENNMVCDLCDCCEDHCFCGYCDNDKCYNSGLNATNNDYTPVGIDNLCEDGFCEWCHTTKSHPNLVNQGYVASPYCECHAFNAESFEAELSHEDKATRIMENIQQNLKTPDAVKYYYEIFYGYPPAEDYEGDMALEVIEGVSQNLNGKEFVDYMYEEMYNAESFGADEDFEEKYEGLLGEDGYIDFDGIKRCIEEREEMKELLYDAIPYIGTPDMDTTTEHARGLVERINQWGAESFEAPGEVEEEDFIPMDITQCHVCARPYEYSRIARALVQHYLKESDDGTKGWKNKSTPDGTRRTVRNIAGYQLYWYGLGALENYLEEGKISKMTPMVIDLLRTAIVPNIIAGDVVQFIESMEIDDIENTDPTFFTDFSDTWEAPDDRLRPERPSDETGDSRKDRKKPRKPWRAENQPSE